MSLAFVVSRMGYFDSQTPLMAALKSQQEPRLIEALLELRADLNAASRSGPEASGDAPDRSRGFLKQGPLKNTSCPFEAWLLPPNTGTPPFTRQCSGV